jgi:hypothetical protein
MYRRRDVRSVKKKEERESKGKFKKGGGKDMEGGGRVIEMKIRFITLHCLSKLWIFRFSSSLSLSFEKTRTGSLSSPSSPLPGPNFVVCVNSIEKKN